MLYRYRSNLMCRAPAAGVYARRGSSAEDPNSAHAPRKEVELCLRVKVAPEHLRGCHMMLRARDAHASGHRHVCCVIFPLSVRSPYGCSMRSPMPLEFRQWNSDSLARLHV